MSILRRILTLFQSEAHSFVDKIEDPIKMTEQGIRDLRNDLHKAMTSLAEVKAMGIRTRRDAEKRKKIAADYERKAMLLLQRMQEGDLDPAEAERLATEALGEKEKNAAEAVRLTQEAERHEEMAGQLQANVNKIKSTISNYQSDLTTLKARARTAAATKKINKQIAQVDPSGTIAMLEKMRNKVEEDESLAAAYGELAAVDKSIDDEINAALAGGSTSTVSESLLEMKQKLGIS
jgi:phage shock protein A